MASTDPWLGYIHKQQVELAASEINYCINYMESQQSTTGAF